MKTNIQDIFKVIIVEDNIYYNKMLFFLINKKLNSISRSENLLFELNSFYEFKDFEVNSGNRIHLAFVDFYLENNNTALNVISKLRKNDYNCKVIILSDFKNQVDMQKCLNAGASGMIFKDRNTLSLCDFVIDEQINMMRHGI